MFAFGFLVIAVGVWLGSSAVQNRSPIGTIEAIIKDPKNVRTTLLTSKGTGYQSTTGTAVKGGTWPVGVPLTAASSAAVGAGASPVAAAAVAYATAQVGKPYLWGASGPNAFDCSGLCYAAYKSAGMTIPRTTTTQLLAGKPVSKSDLMPGDLVFPYPGHVFMYSGGGATIEAPRTGQNVKIGTVYGFMTARRYA